MAFNPIIIGGSPQLYPEEKIIISIPSVEASIEFNNNMSLTKRDGSLILTNCRIIFINHNHSEQFKNFALHIDLISEESFPSIDEKLYFIGTILPYHTFMPCEGKFKIEMNNQHFHEFKDKIQNFIRQIKIAKSRPVNNLHSDSNQVFVDPNRPDFLMVVAEETKQID